MKKTTKSMVNGIFAAAIVLSIGAISVFAASATDNRGFVDADYDGVCDYAGSGYRYTDQDGDGICDYAGNGCRYIDEDGDGVCDNDSADQNRGNRRNGNLRNFIDADNDGNCDNYLSGQGFRQGRGICGGRNR